MLTPQFIKQKIVTCFFRLSMGGLLFVSFSAVCLLCGPLPVTAQQKTIHGQVTNEKGTPVAGATVSVKGTSTGTSTNPNGEFAISNPAMALMTTRFGSRRTVTPGDVYWDLFQRNNQNRKTAGNKEAIWVIQIETDVQGGAGSTTNGAQFGVYAAERVHAPLLRDLKSVVNGVQVSLFNWPMGDYTGGRGVGFLAPSYWFSDTVWQSDFNNDLRNVVRARANATPVAAGNVTIDYILDERLRELGIEEKRMLTLMRLGKWVDRVRKCNPFYGPQMKDNYNLWPIPVTEISKNNKAVLEQNPGYN